MNAVEFNNLKICLNDEVIHDDFSFSIPQNSKFALVGESGSGKSTLLNAIVGFVPVESGSIFINGQELNSKSIHEIRQQIAYLPQNIGFNLETVEQMFNAPFEFESNIENKPKKDDIENVFAHFLLPQGILKKNLREISGGQKQRVLLACSLLLNKSIILLDEPTSALDIKLKEKVTDYILSRKDKTIIAVTHDHYWGEKSNQILNLSQQV
jgi:ABC-type bacteriocin/lantibiotic exporter with double-glycine peptidase domain